MKNPHARRFADVPGTRRPPTPKRHDPTRNVITGEPHEPCPGCGSKTTIHIAGCVREFPF